MSILHLLLVVVCLVNSSESNEDLTYQVQPQSIRINKFDEIYMTSNDHFIGQVLYRYDQLELACECQTSSMKSKYHIYWTINNQVYNKYNQSNNIEILINKNTVQAPITFVTCYCVFIESNRTKTILDYQYKLYIDLDGEPSLPPIDYTIEESLIKQKCYNFVHGRLGVMLSFVFIIMGITFLLIIMSSTYCTKYIIDE